MRKKKPARGRTSISLHSPLLRKSQKAARRDGKTLSALIAELLTNYHEGVKR